MCGVHSPVWYQPLEWLRWSPILRQCTLPSLILFLLSFVVLLAPTPIFAGEPDDLVDEALRANPDLLSRRARVSELESLARVAGSWSDPMIALEYSNAPVTTMALSDHPMAGLQLRALQTFRPLGWSRLHRETGRARAEGAEALLAETEVQLGASVRGLYWRLTLTRQLEQVTKEHVARTQELLSAVMSRYEVGKAGQHSVLRMQVLSDQLTDELLEFDKLDREFTAALTRALARHDGTFETPTELEPVKPPEGSERWIEQALESRPALDIIRAEIEGSKTAANLSRLEGLPDPTVWLGYRVRFTDTTTDPGTDLLSAGVSVPIPVGSGRRARGTRLAHLEAARRAQARLEAAEDKLVTDLETVHAQWSRSFAKSSTYRRELLPLALSMLETTLSDYAVDKANFSSLYEAQVAVLELERAMQSATAETHIRQAEATALMGGKLPGDSP
jgi:outer membrane protein, heavy metal efflux system